MSWVEAILLLLGGAALLLAIGLPVALAFMTMNVIGALIFLGGEPGLMQMSRNMAVSVTAVSLTPIPFFILMGEVLFHTGLAMKAIDAIDRLITELPGRLAIVTVVAGTVFSAISGNTVATTAILGSLLLPNMLARGYHPYMAIGPILAIGSVDMLIPPSGLTVLFGSLSGISISRLLVGGIVPGIIMAVAIVGFIMISAWLRPSLAPRSEAGNTTATGSRWRPFFVYVVPLTGIFIAVIGSMTSGLATPTESAALGALATIVACILYKSFTWKHMQAALRATAEISAVVLFIVMAATTFSQILGFSGATNGLVSTITAQGLTPTQLIIGMLAILLFLGLFVDQVSMMLMTLPFFMPLVASANIDPIWYGVLFLIAMQIGLLTPPFGFLLFALKSVAPPEVTMGMINRAVAPYVAFALGLLVLVFFVPAVATWLPAILFR